MAGKVNHDGWGGTGQPCLRVNLQIKSHWEFPELQAHGSCCSGKMDKSVSST